MICAMYTRFLTIEHYVSSLEVPFLRKLWWDGAISVRNDFLIAIGQLFKNEQMDRFSAASLTFSCRIFIIDGSRDLVYDLQILCKPRNDISGEISVRCLTSQPFKRYVISKDCTPGFERFYCLSTFEPDSIDRKSRNFIVGRAIT